MPPAFAEQEVAGLPAAMVVYEVPILVFPSSAGDSNIYATDQVDIDRRRVIAIISAMRRNLGWEFLLDDVELDDYLFQGSLSWELDKAGDADIIIGPLSMDGTPVLFGEF